MLIDVRSIPEGHSSVERESALEGFREELPPFAAPLRCRAEVDRFGDTIAAAVRFDGAFDMECARCLGKARVLVDGDLRVIIKEASGAHGASVDDEDGVDFYSDVNRNDPVDIGPAIYDEIMIALPLKPLCSEDCRGIIEAEVGDGDDGKTVDPRWEALKKML